MPVVCASEHDVCKNCTHVFQPTSETAGIKVNKKTQKDAPFGQKMLIFPHSYAQVCKKGTHEFEITIAQEQASVWRTTTSNWNKFYH